MVAVANLAFCPDIKHERDCDNMWRVVSISSARSARPHNSSLSNSAFIRDESIDGVCSKKGRSSPVRPADWKFTRSTRLNGELRDNSLFQSFIVSYGGTLRKVSYHPRLSSSKVVLTERHYNIFFYANPLFPRFHQCLFLRGCFRGCERRKNEKSYHEK